MSNTPILAIHLDASRAGGAPAAVRVPSAPDLMTDRISLAAGDVYNLQLQWRDFSASDAGADWQWPSGFAVDAVIAVESSLSLATPTQVAAVASFSESGTGTHLYSGVLDLSDAEVLAAIGEAYSVNAVLDVRVTVSGKRYTFRISIAVYRSADGAYPAPGAGGVGMVNSSNGQLRQRVDGRWEIYDTGRGGWSEVVLKNGQIQFVESSN